MEKRGKTIHPGTEVQEALAVKKLVKHKINRQQREKFIYGKIFKSHFWEGGEVVGHLKFIPIFKNGKISKSHIFGRGGGCTSPPCENFSKSKPA